TRSLVLRFNTQLAKAASVLSVGLKSFGSWPWLRPPPVLVDSGEQRLDEIGTGWSRRHGGGRGQGICGFHDGVLSIGSQFSQEVAERRPILQIELTVQGIETLLNV